MIVATRSSFSSELSESQLHRAVPSAFADTAHPRCSSRYRHIPTSNVIESMKRAGFVPSYAQQCNTRTHAAAQHAKHMIRFRRRSDAGDAIELGHLYPEVVLVNSHNGTSAYEVYAGLHRLICTNGLMVGESIDAIRVPHKGNVVSTVTDASLAIAESSTRAIGVAYRMAQVHLSDEEQINFARTALELCFGPGKPGDSSIAATIEPTLFLRPRRGSDRSADLFTTFNVVQENLIRGGIPGIRFSPAARAVHYRTREIRSIDRNVSLNRALFTLAESVLVAREAA